MQGVQILAVLRDQKQVSYFAEVCSPQSRKQGVKNETEEEKAKAVRTEMKGQRINSIRDMVEEQKAQWKNKSDKKP